MVSFDRSFAAAVRQTSRLEAALAEWPFDDESADMPADLANALWSDANQTSQMIQHEERLQGWLN